MTDDNPRTETARDTDDRDLIEGMADTPAFSGSKGAGPATDVASRDELKRATGADAGITRVEKDDKVQPDTGTRSDHQGAQGTGNPREER